MKEQTAVEWLVEQICGDHTDLWQKEIEQAKEMEKEHIETAFEEGMFHHTNGLCPNEYYNETFKQQEQ